MSALNFPQDTALDMDERLLAMPMEDMLENTFQVISKVINGDIGSLEG